MALPHMGEWQLVTAARLAVDSEQAQEVRHAPGAPVNQFSGQGEPLNVASGQFLWCRYSHHGPFQAPMVTSVNALSSELGRRAQSAPLPPPPLTLCLFLPPLTPNHTAMPSTGLKCSSPSRPCSQKPPLGRGFHCQPLDSGREALGILSNIKHFTSPTPTPRPPKQDKDNQEGGRAHRGLERRGVPLTFQNGSSCRQGG